MIQFEDTEGRRSDGKSCQWFGGTCDVTVLGSIGVNQDVHSVLNFETKQFNNIIRINFGDTLDIKGELKNPLIWKFDDEYKVRVIKFLFNSLLKIMAQKR